MNHQKIAMFEVDNSIDQLNQMLADRGLTAGDVVAIHEQPAAAMRIDKANQAKLRVYVRAGA